MPQPVKQLANLLMIEDILESMQPLMNPERPEDMIEIENIHQLVIETDEVALAPNFRKLLAHLTHYYEEPQEADKPTGLMPAEELDKNLSTSPLFKDILRDMNIVISEKFDTEIPGGNVKIDLMLDWSGLPGWKDDLPQEDKHTIINKYVVGSLTQIHDTLQEDLETNHPAMLANYRQRQASSQVKDDRISDVFYNMFLINKTQYLLESLRKQHGEEMVEDHPTVMGTFPAENEQEAINITRLIYFAMIKQRDGSAKEVLRYIDKALSENTEFFEYDPETRQATITISPHHDKLSWNQVVDIMEKNLVKFDREGLRLSKQPPKKLKTKQREEDSESKEQREARIAKEKEERLAQIEERKIEAAQLPQPYCLKDINDGIGYLQGTHGVPPLALKEAAAMLADAATSLAENLDVRDADTLALAGLEGEDLENKVRLHQMHQALGEALLSSENLKQAAASLGMEPHKLFGDQPARHGTEEKNKKRIKQIQEFLQRDDVQEKLEALCLEIPGLMLLVNAATEKSLHNLNEKNEAWLGKTGTELAEAYELLKELPDDFKPLVEQTVSSISASRIPR